MNPEATFKELQQLVEKAESYLKQYPEDQSLKHSQWSLHQQLEHLCLTGRSTPKLIQDAIDGTCEKPLNADGQRLFKLGSFPRGETHAPSFAIPKGSSVKKIQQGFSRLKNNLLDMSQLPSSSFTGEGRSEHPLLGGLKALEWLCFLRMHFIHHLSIIEEEIPLRQES